MQMLPYDAGRLTRQSSACIMTCVRSLSAVYGVIINRCMQATIRNNMSCAGDVGLMVQVTVKKMLEYWSTAEMFADSILGTWVLRLSFFQVARTKRVPSIACAADLGRSVWNYSMCRLCFCCSCNRMLVGAISIEWH